MRRSMLSNIARLLLLGLIVATGTGCNLIAGTHYAVMGPPKVDPLYVPAQTPMLVLVENYRQHDPYGTDSDLLANMITNELREHAVAPVIDPNLLENLRQEQGAAFQQMRIGDIGKALKADQVLYVDLIGSRASVQPGDVIDARVVLKVKIIESATGNTLWPLDSAGGYAVNHEVRPVKSRPGVDTASVRDDMMQAAAVKVGQLFYAWKPKDMYEHDNAGQ